VRRVVGAISTISIPDVPVGTMFVWPELFESASLVYMGLTPSLGRLQSARRVGRHKTDYDSGPNVDA
jgi:hypothetical protein